MWDADCGVVVLAALRHDADKDGAREKSVAEALDAAPYVIRGAKYRIGSQFHFYMEPQARTTFKARGKGQFTLQSDAVLMSNRSVVTSSSCSQRVRQG